MKGKKYQKLKYKKGEKDKMLKDGFPICISNFKTQGEHCNTCIKTFRKKL